MMIIQGIKDTYKSLRRIEITNLCTAETFFTGNIVIIKKQSNLYTACNSNLIFLSVRVCKHLHSVEK